MSLRDWSQTASGNSNIAGINFAEGQTPGTVNNSARELMAQIRQQYTPAQWNWIEISATASVNTQTVIKLPGNLTSDFFAGRRVRISGGSTQPTRYVVSSSYTSETTVTLQGGASLSASHTIVAFAGVDNAANIYVASTVAELQALTTDRFSGNKVFLTAYYPTASYADATARGGGWLSLKAGDFSTTADSALVFTDASSRRWQRDHEGIIKLSQCGAKVDSTADDTTAVNRAIALINDASTDIHTIYSDPGSVALTATPDPIVKAGRAIIGDGLNISEWRLLAGNAVGTFLQLGTDSATASGGCTRFTLSGLGFLNANETSLTGSFAAVWFRNAIQVVAQNLHFNGCNTVFRYGGSSTSYETATRIMVSNVHAQPSLYDGASVIDIKSATACMMVNSQFHGTGTGVTNSRLVSIIPSAAGVGCDDIRFTGCYWNFNATDIDYGFELDATRPGIANIRFTGCTMDGGLQYSILFKIAAIAPSDSARIYNVGINNSRISASTNHASEGGGGILIDHKADNYISGISICDNVFSLGPKRGIYHDKAGGVSVDTTGFVISGNTFANAYTNADAANTTRPVIEVNGNNFVITGNNVVSQAENVAAASGADFFTYFLVIGNANARNIVCDGNNVGRINERYAVETSALNAQGFMLGPKISNNAGKGDGPIRMVTTTDATVTSLAEQSISFGADYVMRGTVIGRAGAAVRAWYEYEAMTRASTSGTATVIASTVTAKTETDTNWNVTVDASSTSFRVRVQGSATASWGLYQPSFFIRSAP